MDLDPYRLLSLYTDMLGSLFSCINEDGESQEG